LTSSFRKGPLEAQLLAKLIIKPKSLSADELDKLTRSTTCAQVADWLNAYVVAEHSEKEALREKWMKAKDRWAARAGWNLTASHVNKGADDIDLPALLDRIEKEMPKAMPEVQWTMNNTLAVKLASTTPSSANAQSPLVRKSACTATGQFPRAALPPMCRCGWRPW
jgi:3-methyladenine DNA glycosylase AlkD